MGGITALFLGPSKMSRWRPLLQRMLKSAPNQSCLNLRLVVMKSLYVCVVQSELIYICVSHLDTSYASLLLYLTPHYNTMLNRFSSLIVSRLLVNQHSFGPHFPVPGTVYRHWINLGSCDVPNGRWWELFKFRWLDLESRLSSGTCAVVLEWPVFPSGSKRACSTAQEL